MNRAISSKTPRKITISPSFLSVITAGVPVEPEEDMEEEREEDMEEEWEENMEKEWEDERDGDIVANYPWNT